MTGILTFETKHGVVAVEIDEDVARAAGGETREIPVGKLGYTAKGAGDIIAKAPKTFDEALSTLSACASSLEDLIGKIDIAPSEVAVEVGLKLSGTAGFIIAKAGSETEMKVALKWVTNRGKEATN